MDKKDKESVSEVMLYTRYFGCGTYNLMMMLFIIYYAM
jgi:hypothetical protein